MLKTKVEKVYEKMFWPVMVMNAFNTHEWTCQKKHGHRHCVRETIVRETLRETKLQRCFGVCASHF